MCSGCDARGLAEALSWTEQSTRSRWVHDVAELKKAAVGSQMHKVSTNSFLHPNKAQTGPSEQHTQCTSWTRPTEDKLSMFVFSVSDILARLPEVMSPVISTVVQQKSDDPD